MVDTLLMYHLLKAIPSHAHLILVGDVDQLPSVGPGNVLKDIIRSGKFTVVRLTEIFRQARESMIVVNAHKVNQGQLPVLKEIDKPEKADFQFIQEEDPEKILQISWTSAVKGYPGILVSSLREIQVLTPMHKGRIGVANLNIELQKRLNPGQSGITRGAWNFRLGTR